MKNFLSIFAVSAIAICIGTTSIMATEIEPTGDGSETVGGDMYAYTIERLKNIDKNSDGGSIAKETAETIGNTLGDDEGDDSDDDSDDDDDDDDDECKSQVCCIDANGQPVYAVPVAGLGGCSCDAFAAICGQ